MRALSRYGHTCTTSKSTTCRIILLAFFLTALPGAACAGGLDIQTSANGMPYITYNNAPAFGYGASPQHILTYLPTGNGNDYQAWLDWARKYGMNHVRSYPPSFIVEAPSINLFERASAGSDKFDLTQFNEDYFEELLQACRMMRDNGFFVHFQLWQAVSWKKQWQKNYYNPENNINPDISQHAGPGEFMTINNPALLEHQISYVNKILDTVASLGNVYFDIANEIGNGTDSDKKWVLKILGAIRQWEKKNNQKILVTINDEGGKRITGIEEIFNKSDLIIKDLGRWDEHVQAQKKYNKPTISVRNIDWDYIKKQRQYFFADDNLEINEDKNLQIRGRKYWWRMYMAKVQMAGAYSDSYDAISTFPGAQLINKILITLGISNGLPKMMKRSYDLNTLTENNFVNFKNFIQKIHDFPSLQTYYDIVKNHPAAHNYCLQSPKEVVIYLESPNGRSGYAYPKTQALLTHILLTDGEYTGYYYHPASGVKTEFKTVISNNTTILNIPDFSDDLAIYIHQAEPPADLLKH